jgi:diketogulonate reductase-like aldo/keto reductase
LSDKLVEAYHSYQIDTAVIYGAERISAEKEMKEALDFEISLAKVFIMTKVAIFRYFCGFLF